MKKALKNLGLALTAVFFVACSKSDDNGGIPPADGQKMKIEITNVGDLSSFEQDLLLQVVTTNGIVVNVEGEDWAGGTTMEFMPTIIFKKSGEVKAKTVLTTTDIVKAMTIIFGLSKKQDTEGIVNTNVKIYSNDKLIKDYNHVSSTDKADSFEIVSTHNGEVVVK